MIYSFGTIAASVKKSFDVPTAAVTIGPICFLLVSAPVNFIANPIIDNKGPYPSMAFGCVITLIAGWLRLLILKDFYISVIGMVVLSTMSPFIMNCLTAVTFNWFSP